MKQFKIKKIFSRETSMTCDIDHMVWQPYWIYPKIEKYLNLQNSGPDRGESSQKCSPSLADTRVFTNN